MEKYFLASLVNLQINEVIRVCHRFTRSSLHSKKNSDKMLKRQEKDKSHIFSQNPGNLIISREKKTWENNLSDERKISHFLHVYPN